MPVAPPGLSFFLYLYTCEIFSPRYLFRVQKTAYCSYSVFLLWSRHVPADRLSFFLVFFFFPISPILFVLSMSFSHSAIRLFHTHWRRGCQVSQVRSDCRPDQLIHFNSARMGNALLNSSVEHKQSCDSGITELGGKTITSVQQMTDFQKWTTED